MTVDYDEFVRMAKKGLVSEYTIEEIYGRMMAKEVSNEVGVYIDFDRYYFSMESNKSKISVKDIDTYDDLLDWVESQVSSAGGKDTVKVIDHFKYDLQGLYQEDKLGQFHYSTSAVGSPIRPLCNLLAYVVNGNLDTGNGNIFVDSARKYAENHPDEETPIYISGYSWETNYGIWFDMGKTIDPQFDGLQVKFFKNGKVQVKGLTSKEWDKVTEVFTLIKDVRYY